MLKIIQTQNAQLVQEVRQRLKENGGHCPCKLLRNEDTKCLCKEFRDAIESEELGKCHCGLYELVDEPDKQIGEKHDKKRC